MARKKAKALPPKMITVYAEILQETELAILVRCDDLNNYTPVAAATEAASQGAGAVQ